MLEYGHIFGKINKILDIEHNYNKRLITEMIYIKEQKNGINCKKDTEILNGSYFDILKEIFNDSN